MTLEDIQALAKEEPEHVVWNMSDEATSTTLMGEALPVPVAPGACLVVWPSGRWVMWKIEATP